MNRLSRFLKKVFPVIVSYVAAYLVAQALNYIADAFGMDKDGALFMFLAWVFGGFSVCAYFWWVGEFVKSRFPMICRIVHIVAVATYALGIPLAIVNFFYPIF